MKITTPKFNSEFNLTVPSSYYDYENYSINPGNIELYKVSSVLGKGKYSEVFKGISQNKEMIVIKVLKPIKKTKVYREVLILKNLDHKNIIRLKDVVFDKYSKSYSIIFDYILHCDTYKILKECNLRDCIKYSTQILQGLKYAHSRGIMHRDIKPGNLIINKKTKELKIIDWGLAEFYHLKKEYSPRVATKNYKSPEILLEYKYYDYSLDIWSFGCILAEMMTKKQPFFRPSKKETMLNEIIKKLGTTQFKAYLTKYEIDYEIEGNTEVEKEDLKKYIKEEFLALEKILVKIFVYDHHERISAAEILEDEIFNKQM